MWEMEFGLWPCVMGDRAVVRAGWLLGRLRASVGFLHVVVGVGFLRESFLVHVSVVTCVDTCSFSFVLVKNA